MPTNSDLGLSHLRLSYQSNALCAHLVTSFTSSHVSYSATYLPDPSLEYPLDLIAFLAAAQWRGIDLLPITWQPALDTAGRGATAEIQQSIINLSLTLAFKRFLFSPDSGTYRAIITELCILGHPAVKEHPNIIKLLGVCWDVVSEDEIRPVLVFEKTKHGNLNEFVVSEEARLLSSEQWLNLYTGIANAIVTMHSCGRCLNYLSRLPVTDNLVRHYPR